MSDSGASGQGMQDAGQQPVPPAPPGLRPGTAGPPVDHRAWRPPAPRDGAPDASSPPADGRAESGAEERPARTSAASDWLNRLLGRPVRSAEAGDEGEAPRGEPAPRPDADGQEPSRARSGEQQRPPPRLSERAGAIAQQLGSLTGEELGALAQGDGPFARAVQSELDRRIARANRQRDEQGRFVRQQRIEGLKQQARQARQSDVYKAAELEEQVDALQQQEAFVRGLVEAYDRASVDPIVSALPEADRAPLLADLPDGLEGRAQLVRAALKRLEQVWRADEARKLRGGAQRKRENAARRRDAEDDGEPELVPGIGRGRNGKASMNDWLRAQL